MVSFIQEANIDNQGDYGIKKGLKIPAGAEKKFLFKLTILQKHMNYIETQMVLEKNLEMKECHQ
jgi:hypothetical protein